MCLCVCVCVLPSCVFLVMRCVHDQRGDGIQMALVECSVLMTQLHGDLMVCAC